MQKIIVTAGPYAAASTTAICTAQQGSGGLLTLNGTTAGVLDQPRRVLFTDAGNNTSVSYIVTGTTFAKQPVVETVAGTNTGTGVTKTDFATVTSIAISGAAQAPTNVSVGTNTVAGSSWIRFDEWSQPSVTCQLYFTGSVTVTVEVTNDDPNFWYGAATNISGPAGLGSITIPSVTWDATLPGISNATANTTVQMQTVPVYMRMRVTTFTAGAGNFVTMIAEQTGVTPY